MDRILFTQGLEQRVWIQLELRVRRIESYPARCHTWAAS